MNNDIEIISSGVCRCIRALNSSWIVGNLYSYTYSKHRIYSVAIPEIHIDSSDSFIPDQFNSLFVDIVEYRDIQLNKIVSL